MTDLSEKPTGRPKNKTPYDFITYFGKDRRLHSWFAELRTRLLSSVFPWFARTGLVPDTISYIGIALLAGVALYFVRRPFLAVLFLAAHVICDGLDGAFARHTGKASQSGAFTDLVCDQLGMVIVAMAAIFHHLVSPVLGAAYITLYLIVVVFGVIINVMGLGARITITSKYFLYIVYLLWAAWGMNFFTALMSFFSAIMVVEVTIGYLRLKRGIRRKFDAEVRFSAGDPYSGRLNYALNMAVPVAVFLAIILAANRIPIAAMLDLPKSQVTWTAGPMIPGLGDAKVIGIGAQDERFIIMTESEDGTAKISRYTSFTAEPESFECPEYISPALSTFPMDANVMLIADKTTRLLLGFDLDASCAAGRPVIVVTLPLEYLRVTAMATDEYEGRKVWLVSNYLYTRKTYIIDPESAMKKGKLLAGVIGSYVNAGFPSGLAMRSGSVYEFNRTPAQQLIYSAPLSRLVPARSLLHRAAVSFTPPEPDCMGPVIKGDSLYMATRSGRLYRLRISSLPPLYTQTASRED